MMTNHLALEILVFCVTSGNITFNVTLIWMKARQESNQKGNTSTNRKPRRRGLFTQTWPNAIIISQQQNCQTICELAGAASETLEETIESGPRLRHTLLPRTFYCSGTLCIVSFCSKEQFASKHTLPLSTLCLLEYFSPWNILLPNPLCFLEPFSHQHNLLLNTHCSS